MEQRKIIFIDRDGTLIKEPADEQVDSLEKLSFLEGLLCGLSRIKAYTNFGLVMVTNQDGVGTGAFPEKDFWPAQNKMLEVLKGEGIEFDDIFIDRSYPEDGLPTRKPGTAMLTKYLEGSYDLGASFVIGDRLTDLEMARNLGSRGILIGSKKRKVEVERAGLSESCALITSDWAEIARYLETMGRTVTVERISKETEIKITLNLDGNGTAEVNTGIGFFDHMLELVAKHGGLDLRVEVTGDLHIDEHHTIEDTGIVLGEALQKAMGGKIGMERYGFALPMDESRAEVLLDFGGRSWFSWKADFTREKIGEMPTEMVSHFFSALADSARCNLHIFADGENEHHKIEGIFKAFARALRMALKRETLKGTLPSTKGIL